MEKASESTRVRWLLRDRHRSGKPARGIGSMPTFARRQVELDGDGDRLRVLPLAEVGTSTRKLFEGRPFRQYERKRSIVEQSRDAGLFGARSADLVHGIFSTVTRKQGSRPKLPNLIYSPARRGAEWRRAGASRRPG